MNHAKYALVINLCCHLDSKTSRLNIYDLWHETIYVDVLHVYIHRCCGGEVKTMKLNDNRPLSIYSSDYTDCHGRTRDYNYECFTGKIEFEFFFKRESLRDSPARNQSSIGLIDD